MPVIAQFEAAARETLDAEDPFTFVLAGETFVVRGVVTAMDAVRAERSDSLASVVDLIAGIIEPGEGEQERLEAAFDACQLTIEQLQTLVGKVVGAQTARPTRPSSGSAAGPSKSTSTSSSERASKLASLGLAPADEPSGSPV